MAKKAEVKVGFFANIKDFMSKTDKMQRRTEQMATKDFAKLKGAIIGAFSVAAVTSFAREVIAMGAKVDALATRTGFGAEAIQAFSNAAMDGGASIDEVNVALVTLRKQQQAVLNGNKNTAKTFEMLGISAEEVANSSMEELLQKTAEGIAASGNMGAAFTLLGENAARIQSALKRVADEGLAAITSEAIKAGEALTDLEVKRLAAAQAEIDRLKRKGLVAGGRGASAGFEFAEKTGEKGAFGKLLTFIDPVTRLVTAFDALTKMPSVRSSVSTRAGSLPAWMIPGQGGAEYGPRNQTANEAAGAALGAQVAAQMAKVFTGNATMGVSTSGGMMELERLITGGRNQQFSNLRSIGANVLGTGTTQSPEIRIEKEQLEVQKGIQQGIKKLPTAIGAQIQVGVFKP